MLQGLLDGLFNGISIGSVLLIAALGLAVVFGLMGVINLAHGELMMLGAYTTFVVQNGSAWGLRIRAVTQNRSMSACLGIPTKKVDALTFALGSGLAGVAGCAIAMHLKLQVPPNELPDFMGLYGVTELPSFWKPFYSFPFAAAAVVIIPALLAALLGYLVFRNRIQCVYFSILTQAATIVFFNFFNGQQKLFNGTNGLTDFKTLFGASVSAAQTQFFFYTLTVLFLAAAYALCRWLTSGRFGRLLMAIRDDESRVRFSGYDPTDFKVLVFAVSGGLAGIAGALYTLQTQSISPRAMDIAFSIEMVIWVAVGGRASLVGAVLGALLVNFARSFLSEQFAEVWLFFQGALFLIVVTVLPDGLVGWLRSRIKVERERQNLRK